MYADYSEKLAKLIVNYSVEVEENDSVALFAPTLAEPLVREVYREVLEAGGHMVHLGLSFNGQQELYYTYASDEQLTYVSDLRRQLYKTTKKFIMVHSDFNTRALSNIDPSRLMKSQQAGQELNVLFDQRAATKDLRWTLVPYPCDAFAQEAEMGMFEFLKFSYEALNLHQPDPIAFWRSFKDQQDKIIQVLERGSEFRIVGQDTDLTLQVGGRKWINCCGDNNLPDGEVFTGPHECGVEGSIRFTYPGIYQGQEIEDIRLTFKEGKVVEAHASKGQKLLDQVLEVPGARVLGELAVGTNYGIDRFIKNMLFDEKMGGTIHLALGSGYPESGSTNESSIHWDILKEMKSEDSKIFLDGEVIYRAGQWLIP